MPSRKGAFSLSLTIHRPHVNLKKHKFAILFCSFPLPPRSSLESLSKTILPLLVLTTIFSLTNKAVCGTLISEIELANAN